MRRNFLSLTRQSVPPSRASAGAWFDDNECPVEFDVEMLPDDPRRMYTP